MEFGANPSTFGVKPISQPEWGRAWEWNLPLVIDLDLEIASPTVVAEEVACVKGQRSALAKRLQRYTPTSCTLHPTLYPTPHTLHRWETLFAATKPWCSSTHRYLGWLGRSKGNKLKMA